MWSALVSLGRFFLFFKILFIYSWETYREREAETQTEGEAGSKQGSWRGTRSWVPRITPWAEGSAKVLSHPGCPLRILFNVTYGHILIPYYLDLDMWKIAFHCEFMSKVLHLSHIYFCLSFLFHMFKSYLRAPGWLSGLASPSAQGMILETQDWVPHRAPCMEPASPSACVSASLSLCHE